ncbi:hypothetical protein [Silvibacterium dinghuense]|uniref:Uncharacterized protein n=1 Tax=Silvibacterium dinghuense TaxID=1560006 RepID=A0A4Q1SJ76_9BACT|nr:hypothetical protein [Silvibacterium dinghuense]RXS97676.1 hypothetical protein ESZ00_07320 [Silvibacterium dinghuense]GGH01045.1 hypothetical protein GCM10011586_15860 [Silvibacterium dinghuense]
MSKASTWVRELAAWGLDEDEYRPAKYCGDVDTARALLSRRPSFDAESAMVECASSTLQTGFAEHALRADLRAEMAGLAWSLGVVDLRKLIAFQRRITLVPAASESSLPAADDWDSLMQLCFAEPKVVACDVTHASGSLVLRSGNPNLQARITGNAASLVSVHTGSPFFEVAEYRGRWFLRDGYHRAYHCLRDGVFHLPAVIVHAGTLAELGAVHPWFFPEAVLLSATPPRVIDFLDDALVIQYARLPLIKTIRITVEEAYTLEGEA